MSAVVVIVPFMAIVDALEDDEHWPEYGTLVVCDAPAEPGVEELPWLEGWWEQGAVDAQPAGTIARSGQAWLEARAADEYHRVRLEAHDAAPPDDRDDWDDVVEMPYRCRSGSVGIGTLTGGYVDPSIRLGPPGLYRARVARRPAAEVSGDLFRVQFWPTGGPRPDLPRWLRRHGTPLDEPAPTVPDPASAFHRYAAFASDLVTVTIWSGEDARLTITLGDLADRLLATVEQTRETLDYALDQGLLALDHGDTTDPRALLALRALPRRPPPVHYEPMALPRPGPPWDGSLTTPEPAPPPTASTGEYGWHAAFVSASARPAPYLPPWGAPPASGFVSTAGDVVLWRDGASTTLARWRPRRPYEQIDRALETAHGIVLISSSEAVLVDHDGRVIPIGSEPMGHGVIADDAHHFAYVETHLGRNSYTRLHLVDLADRSRRTMPTEDDDLDLRSVLAVHRGVVYALAGVTHLASMAWTPGTKPGRSTPTRREVDTLTGTALADERDGVVVIQPDGRRRQLPASPQASLSPGARLLYEFHYQPRGITVYDLAGDQPEPNTIWLPLEAETPPAFPPVWETPSRILLRTRYGGGHLQTPLLRVDLLTGTFERVPLPDNAGDDSLAITPALSPPDPT
jgi:hypothetical protein